MAALTLNVKPDSMRIDRSLLVTLALLAGALAACDTREDANLLNPPPPDSSYVRVVNLVPNDPVDVGFPFVPVISALPSMQTSDYRRILIPGQTLLTVARPGIPALDTLANQALAQGAKITYFVLGTRDTSLVLRLSIGKQEEIDLTRRRERQVSFINAISDSGAYFLKVGCQSGDRLFTPTFFAQFPQTVTLKNQEVSLYLFNTLDSTRVLASARLSLNDGARPYLSSYLIAANVGGTPKLFLMREDGTAGPLQEAPPETRTTASVELLNGLTDGGTISARIEGGTGDIATGLGQLTISAPAEVEACINPSGDSLVVTPSSSTAVKAPVRLTVGSRTLVAVYNDSSMVKAITLSRDLPPNLDGKVYLRGVNLATGLVSASVSIGAGAPGNIIPDTRPFGTLKVGAASDYVELAPGTYPFMLSSALTGVFLNGGVEALAPGYYTLVVALQAGSPTLLIVRDDIPGSPLRPVSSQGSRVTFFSMLTDVDATFSAGPLVLPGLAYSYVYSTVLPLDVTSISSNAGSTTVDLVLGSYVIGATGSGNNKKLIAAPSQSDAIPPKSAAFRVLNAIPDGPQLAVRIGGHKVQPIDTISFGAPSPTRILDARQYSMFITSPSDTLILARTDGVELTNGRRYLLVVGPKRQGSTSSSQYELLWVQE